MIPTTGTPIGAISQTERIDGTIVIVLVVVLAVLLVRRGLQLRHLRRRKAASASYHDADVAQYGTGPAGFAGAGSARTADGTSLAPTFAASNPTGPGPTGSPSPPAFGGPGPYGTWTTQTAPGAPPPPTGIPGFGTTPPPTAAAPAPTPPPTPAAPPVPSRPPAGWLPDPAGDPNLLRYWDGGSWTDHTARRS